MYVLQYNKMFLYYYVTISDIQILPLTQYSSLNYYEIKLVLGRFLITLP